MLFYKYKDAGALKFPDEEQTNQSTEPADGFNQNKNNFLFPNELILKLPRDIQTLCHEFNFNYKNNKENSCILILRRILPLSIVRKFQKLDLENEIKKDGDYLDTKTLVNKAEAILKTKRAYKEIINYKLLLDSSQHSYTLNVEITDAQGAGLAMRIFLDDLFGEVLENPSAGL